MVNQSFQADFSLNVGQVSEPVRVAAEWNPLVDEKGRGSLATWLPVCAGRSLDLDPKAALLGLSDNHETVLDKCKPMFGLLWREFLARLFSGAGGMNVAAHGTRISRMNQCDVT